MRSIFSFVEVLLLSLILSWSIPAGAQSSRNKIAAEALFLEGVQLKKEKRYEEALSRFTKSEELESAIGTRLNIADCLEELGKTASAWQRFRDIAAEARARKLAEPEALANQRAQQLEPKLARLSIDVPEDQRHRPPGLRVELDGAEIHPATWGVAVPVDPESHAIVAQAPGHQSYNGSVTISRGPGTVHVTIPALTPNAATPIPIAPAPVAPTAIAPPAQPLRPPDRGFPRSPPSAWNARRSAGVALAAVGVAAIATGVGLGVHAFAIRDQSNEAHCNASTNLCDSTGIELRDKARAFGNGSTAMFAVGSALSVGGAIMAAIPAGRASVGRAAMGFGPLSLIADVRW
jgi:hypothetical protein